LFGSTTIQDTTRSSSRFTLLALSGGSVLFYCMDAPHYAYEHMLLSPFVLCTTLKQISGEHLLCTIAICYCMLPGSSVMHN